VLEDTWADLPWSKQYEYINNTNEVIISIVTQAEPSKNYWSRFFSLSDWLCFSSYTLGICHSLSLSLSLTLYTIPYQIMYFSDAPLYNLLG